MQRLTGYFVSGCCPAVCTWQALATWSCATIPYFISSSTYPPCPGTFHPLLYLCISSTSSIWRSSCMEDRRLNVCVDLQNDLGLMLQLFICRIFSRSSSRMSVSLARSSEEPLTMWRTLSRSTRSPLGFRSFHRRCIYPLPASPCQSHDLANGTRSASWLRILCKLCLCEENWLLANMHA